MSQGVNQPPPPPSGSSDRRRNTTSGSAAGQRRARSSSQPVVAPSSHPIAGPSTGTSSNVRLTDIDFNFLNQFVPGPSGSNSPYPPHQQVPSTSQATYDEEALARAIQNLQSVSSSHPTAAIHSPPPPTHPLQTPLPQIPAMLLGQISGAPPMSNSFLTEAFIAALPWLQYMQVQNQVSQSIQQHQQSPQHQQQPPQSQQQQQLQHLPQYVPPALMAQQTPFNFGSSQFRPFEPSEALDQFMATPEPSSSTHEPSPEAADTTEAEQAAMSDDKRRRNTAASARFRVKKKQWTLNLERTISDLSGRVEELEREAAELRRENGWLKEIVMLKSKRFSGIVPDLEPSADSPSSSTLAGEMSSADVGNLISGSGEGEKSRESSRGRKEEDTTKKGKARQT